KDDLMRAVDRWDFNLSSNRYSSEIWERIYPSYFEELEYGYPRNDRLLTATLDEVRAIRAGLGYDDSHLVILYAPASDERLDSDRLATAAGEHTRVLGIEEQSRAEDLML